MRYDARTFLQTLFHDPDATDGRMSASTVVAKPEDLPMHWRVMWEERAAIMEYCGGRPRAEAEKAALAAVVRQMRSAGKETA